MKRDRKFLMLIIIMLILILKLACYYMVNRKNILYGSWIADGTQIKIILEAEDENIIYADEEPSPYYLNFINEKEYILKLTNSKIEGTYEINNDKEIFFYSKNDQTFTCNLININEITCDTYAYKFIRENKK